MKKLAFAICLAATSALASDPKITLAPVETLNWDTTPEGVAFAPLSGDRHNGAYFAMVELPAGTVSPAHTKSATMYGVMIKGQMTHSMPDTAKAPVVGPGAYYEIPGGLPHVSSCVSATPCVTMLYQNGPFDFVPVTP
ncbi:DUF4437 domain-containing protein [uncultured Tateyamaria sp.]|uniref:cupin domain-containing protein n=1 Tax=uncultured Tateyamaria sp. TaxID=455651 RepID=UPI00260AA0DA|nr:DUF4437 domain-containing protein [uncultured Tateyamaria sp.]